MSNARPAGGIRPAMGPDTAVGLPWRRWWTGPCCPGPGPLQPGQTPQAYTQEVASAWGPWILPIAPSSPPQVPPNVSWPCQLCPPSHAHPAPKGNHNADAILNEIKFDTSGLHCCCSHFENNSGKLVQILCEDTTSHYELKQPAYFQVSTSVWKKDRVSLSLNFNVQI